MFKDNYIDYTRDQLLDLISLLPFRKKLVKGDNVTCICPFHDDTKPSFSIDLNNNGRCQCWSCGAKGNIVTLCMDFLHRHPNEILGINTFDREEIRYDSAFQKALQISSETELAMFVIEQKKKKEVTLNLKGNMLYIDNNCPQELLDYLKKRRISQKFIVDFDLKWCKVLEVNSVLFINRLLIPIKEDNKIISIEGRDFTKKQSKKVLYGKDTTVNSLFNIDNLDFNKTIIMTEGIMELPTLYELGYTNITCLFGALLTKRQEYLLREKIKNIIYIPNNPFLKKEVASRKVIDDLYRIKGDDVRFKILPLPYKDLDTTPIDIVKETLNKESISYKEYKNLPIMQEVKDKWNNFNW